MNHNKKIFFNHSEEGCEGQKKSVSYTKQESGLKKQVWATFLLENNPETGFDPFINDTKNHSNYRVHGIQINHLGRMVST